MDERKHDDRRANGKVKEVVRGVGKCIFSCTQQVQQRYPEYQHQDTHQHADQKGGVKAEGAHPLNAFAIPLSKQPGNQRAAALREDIPHSHHRCEQRHAQGYPSHNVRIVGLRHKEGICQIVYQRYRHAKHYGKSQADIRL